MSQTRSILDAISPAALLVDGDLTVTLADRDFLEATGFNEQDVVGATLAFIFPLERPGNPAFLTQVDEAIAAGEVRALHGLSLVARTGNPVGSELRIVPIAGTPEDEGTSGALIEFSNRAELPTDEKKHWQARKMASLARLAGGVAHDFNNLLMVIMTSAEFAKDEIPDGSPATEDLTDVIAAGDRASSLTRQLLAFSRPQAQNPLVVDLNSLLQDCAAEIRKELGESIELCLKPEADTPLMKADVLQIRDMLSILADNACEAMPDGGKLTLTTADAAVEALAEEELVAGLTPEGDTYVALSVADTGVGMTPEVQANLFEPFFTTRQKGKGPGLGLATVYGILKQHRAGVVVDSAPGTGTTLTFLFPQATGEQ
ncbi:MAG: hypothetical protein HN742_41385 [Lentisphaerae bacterium]|nr:hypothetical protein [Lentisphaerota bacterium]MBT4817474.1 hypothetical protein [Lentisphaerota bacterium]MBT5612743.1 hypothetical protein [Lentisphaerota bacterium]MBT7058972.1 hypothetical protein [Lentisphaerota bacterium]MBT7848392.1 hypothetical protein [Lentisphaerota bacterium]